MADDEEEEHHSTMRFGFEHDDFTDDEREPNTPAEQPPPVVTSTTGGTTVENTIRSSTEGSSQGFTRTFSERQTGSTGGERRVGGDNSYSSDRDFFHDSDQASFNDENTRTLTTSTRHGTTSNGQTSSVTRSGANSNDERADGSFEGGTTSYQGFSSTHDSNRGFDQASSDKDVTGSLTSRFNTTSEQQTSPANPGGHDPKTGTGNEQHGGNNSREDLKSSSIAQPVNELDSTSSVSANTQTPAFRRETASSEQTVPAISSSTNTNTEKDADQTEDDSSREHGSSSVANTSRDADSSSASNMNTQVSSAQQETTSDQPTSSTTGGNTTHPSQLDERKEDEGTPKSSTKRVTEVAATSPSGGVANKDSSASATDDYSTAQHDSGFGEATPFLTSDNTSSSTSPVRKTESVEKSTRHMKEGSHENVKYSSAQKASTGYTSSSSSKSTNKRPSAQHDPISTERTPLLISGNIAPTEDPTIAEATTVSRTKSSSTLRPSEQYRTARRSSRAPEEPTTQLEQSTNDKPLPRDQLLLLCFARLIEPIAFFCVFPFINQMLVKNGNLPDSDTGFYAGLIESLFSLTQMCVMILWGRLADRFGRKPILVISLYGISFATCLFGLARTIWQMILFRCLAGIFAGTVVTIRTMITEHSTPKTQARAFSWFAVAGNLGIFLGPLIGGAFADPNYQFRFIFHDVPFFERYPYSLAMFAAGGIALVAAILCTLFIEETYHPDRNQSTSDTNKPDHFQAKARSNPKLSSDSSPISGPNSTSKLNSGLPSNSKAKTNPGLSSNSTSSDSATKPSTNSDSIFNLNGKTNASASSNTNTNTNGRSTSPTTPASNLNSNQTNTSKPPPTEPTTTLSLLRTPHILPTLYIYSHATLLGFAYTTVLPISLFEPVPLGGLGLPSPLISLFMSLIGASQAIWLLLVFPPLHARIGTGGILRGCAAVWPAIFLVIPLLNILLRIDTLCTTTLFWTLGPIFFMTGVGVSMAFTAVQLALNDVSPGPATLGTLNALALTLVSGLRAVVPAGFGGLYAVGIRGGWIGGQLAWVVLFLVAVGFVAGVRVLPGKAGGLVRRGRTEEEEEEGEGESRWDREGGYGRGS